MGPWLPIFASSQAIITARYAQEVQITQDKVTESVHASEVMDSGVPVLGILSSSAQLSGVQDHHVSD
jgi:hypothetical protein